MTDMSVVSSHGRGYDPQGGGRDLAWESGRCPKPATGKGHLQEAEGGGEKVLVIEEPWVGELEREGQQSWSLVMPPRPPCA